MQLNSIRVVFFLYHFYAASMLFLPTAVLCHFYKVDLCMGLSPYLSAFKKIMEPE